MVAGIDIAVPLHYGCMTTRVSHSANAWSYAYPVGKGGIEELNEHLANIVFRPFIEDFAQEMPPLHALYFEASTLAFPLSTIHHGGELKEAALKVVAEKTVELQGLLGIEVVDNSHCVPLDMIAVENVYAPANASPCGFVLRSAAIGVVNFLRSVDADSDKPMLIVEETRPFLSNKGAVGLQGVGDDVSVGIFLLKLDSVLIERKRTHHCLASVPCEKHLVGGLSRDVLTRELLEQLFAHQMTPLIGIKLLLGEIVAVVASQIAASAHRLQHHIERTGKRRDSHYSKMCYPI